MIKLKEMVQWTNGKYTIEERLINPDHVASVSPDPTTKKELLESVKEEQKLDPQAEFATIELASGTKITVIGSLTEIQGKLFRENRKKLLLG